MSGQSSRANNTLIARLENGFHFPKAFAMFLVTLLHADRWGWSGFASGVALNILFNPEARAIRG